MGLTSTGDRSHPPPPTPMCSMHWPHLCTGRGSTEAPTHRAASAGHLALTAFQPSPWRPGSPSELAHLGKQLNQLEKHHPTTCPFKRKRTVWPGLLQSRNAPPMPELPVPRQAARGMAKTCHSASPPSSQLLSKLQPLQMQGQIVGSLPGKGPGAPHFKKARRS